MLGQHNPGAVLDELRPAGEEGAIEERSPANARCCAPCVPGAGRRRRPIALMSRFELEANAATRFLPISTAMSSPAMKPTFLCAGLTYIPYVCGHAGAR